MIRSIIIAICIAILSTAVFSQKLEDGWKRLLPLKSTLQDAEKALGKPWRIDDNNYYMYQTDEAYIEINYSTAPCAANQYDRGKYRIPENTILSYRVMPKERRKLANFEFERQKYERYLPHKFSSWASYSNTQEGVSIVVNIERDKSETVGTIEFRPTKGESQKAACPNPPSTP